jgi:o-succinylbenzoate---CoA ligase
MKTSAIDIGLNWSSSELRQALADAFIGKQPVKIIASTTGSSGILKRVALSAKTLQLCADLSNSAVGAESGDIWSLLLSTNHIAGLNVLARSIQLGTETVDVNQVASFTAIVPTQLHRALTGDSQLLRHLKNCKAVLLGGAAASSSLLESAEEQGINIVTTYGMTETCGGCVYDNKPLPGVQVKLNSTGLIEIKGPVIADGYENLNELWKSVVSDGWFTTSDLGEIINGKIFIIGRADDVIISGGINISLTAIDSELSESFKSVNFLATSVADSEWGQKLCLLFDADVDEGAISKILRDKFGKHFVPKEFLKVSELPRLGIGKPDRVKARQFFVDEQG